MLQYGGILVDDLPFPAFLFREFPRGANDPSYAASAFVERVAHAGALPVTQHSDCGT
jgi:hypothetical protein